MKKNNPESLQEIIKDHVFHSGGAADQLACQLALPVDEWSSALLSRIIALLEIWKENVQDRLNKEDGDDGLLSPKNEPLYRFDAPAELRILQQVDPQQAIAPKAWSDEIIGFDNHNAPDYEILPLGESRVFIFLDEGMSYFAIPSDLAQQVADLPPWEREALTNVTLRIPIKDSNGKPIGWRETIGNEHVSFSAFISIGLLCVERHRGVIKTYVRLFFQGFDSDQNLPDDPDYTLWEKSQDCFMKLLGVLDQELCKKTGLSREDNKKSTNFIQDSNPETIISTESEIHNAVRSDKNENQDFPSPVIPVPRGTRWSGITITIVDVENVKVQISGALEPPKRYNFAELGFKDGRTVNPTVLWNFFIVGFSNSDSKLDVARIKRVIPATIKNPDYIRRLVFNLRRKLKAIFGISEDPFITWSEIENFELKVRVIGLLPET